MLNTKKMKHRDKKVILMKENQKREQKTSGKKNKSIKFKKRNNRI